MAVVIKILALFGGVIGGVLMMRYNYQLTQLFGYNSLAERYLGSGGTYTMWKLLGVLAILLAIWYVF
jgi:hypothetical protein